MPELNNIYAEAPGWARAHQIGGDEGDTGTQEVLIRVNQGETLVAAPSFETTNVESLSEISAQVLNRDNKVIYKFSLENPYFILNSERDEELRIVVSSTGFSAFSFNISAFGSPPPFFSFSPWRCRLCHITAHAIAAAILLGVTPVLATAVAAFLGVALLAAELIIEILKTLALLEIIDELCKFLGLCPRTAMDYLANVRRAEGGLLAGAGAGAGIEPLPA